MRYRWHADEAAPGLTYAQANIPKAQNNGRATTIRMHVLLLGRGTHRIDHADGDGLNNTRGNLRVATPSQNNMNGSPRRQDRKNAAVRTSPYKGVTWTESGQRWRARIVADGREFGLGSYISELAAALAYDTAARKLFGEYAKPNFPEGKPDIKD
jgi:hypothetical protein